MRPSWATWERIFPIIASSAAIGVAIIIVATVAGWPLASRVGGVLLSPLLLLAGSACLVVVLLAPAWPFAAVAEKVPEWARWPTMAAAVVVTLSWWALWVSIALGDHSDW